jgi:uncharacterized protein YjdB
MVARRVFRGLLLLCLGISLVGCAVSGLDSIQVSPASQALTVGQTTQLTVVGTYGNGNHLRTQPITNGLTWTSSNPSVTSVTSAGLVAAVGAGTSTVTASATAFNGVTSSSSTITVAASTGGVAGGSVISLAVIPGAQSVAAPTQTSQFIAIGTTSSGATVNLTNQVAWSSSSAQIATIGSASGLATAVGKGTATITALYNVGGTVVAGTATFNVTGGAAQQYTAVSITPSSQAISASGQTSQLIALGTFGSTGLSTNVTDSSQIAWSSSTPSIATVSSTGLITGVSVGNSTITALLTNPDGSVVSNTASVAVSNTAAPEPLLSLTIIPSAITVGNLQDTGNFLAIGTFSTVPYVRDLTNSVTWISSFPDVFPVNSNKSATLPVGSTAGVVTAYGSGSATIIAEATSTDGTIQTATATFNCPLALPNPSGNPPTPGSCIAGTQTPALKATITIYNEGLNTSNWLLTAPSASGTPDVIHCGPGWTGSGGSVCSAAYPIDPTGNTVLTVVITAPAQTGVAFGGWTSNCVANPVVPDPVGPNTCTITISPTNPNVTVAGIFN